MLATWEGAKAAAEARRVAAMADFMVRYMCNRTTDLDCAEDGYSVGRIARGDDVDFCVRKFPRACIASTI